MDIRADIYNVLATMVNPVYQSRVNPLTSDKYPCLNVFYRNKSLKNKSHDFLFFELTADVTIAIAVAQTNGYDSTLDTIVDNTLATLLSNDVWVNKFNNISNISIKYGYDKAGETNLAVATIDLTLEVDYLVTQPTYPNLNTVGVAINLGNQDRSTKSENPEDWESVSLDDEETEYQRVIKELSPEVSVLSTTDTTTDYTFITNITQ